MTLPPRSACACACHQGIVTHAFPCCEPDRPVVADIDVGRKPQEAMAMDREAVLVRMAKAICPHAFESWDRHVAYDLERGETLERATEFAKWCDDGAHRLGRVSHARERAQAALDASGLMERIAELEAANALLQKQVQIERSVTGNHPMAKWLTNQHVKSPDDYVWWLESQLRQCLMIRANDPDKEMEDWICGKTSAFEMALLNFKRAMAAEAARLKSARSGTSSPSQPTNSPTDQPQPKE